MHLNSISSRLLHAAMCPISLWVVSNPRIIGFLITHLSNPLQVPFKIGLMALLLTKCKIVLETLEFIRFACLRKCVLVCRSLLGASNRISTREKENTSFSLCGT